MCWQFLPHKIKKKSFVTLFSIKSVNETTAHPCATDLSSGGLHPPSPLPLLNKETSSQWKHQMGALGQQRCQTTQAPLLCGCDTGFYTDHLLKSMNN